MTIHRCDCGRRMSKHAHKCKACHKAHMERLVSTARAIVATGTCPNCAAPLRRNLALTGWWQCSQFGAEGFRADDSKPTCWFQTFVSV